MVLTRLFWTISFGGFIEKKKIDNNKFFWDSSIPWIGGFQNSVGVPTISITYGNIQ